MQIINDGGILSVTGRTSQETLGYLMNFPGEGVFDATYGKVAVIPQDASQHNKLLDAALLKGLDENCLVGQGGIFYVKLEEAGAVVQTWLGTEVSRDVELMRIADRIGVLTITFRRNNKTFRGRYKSDAESFRFKRIK